MKYTFHFKCMIFCTVVLAGATTEFILERMPTLAAAFTCITFYFLMGTLMAPDNEKYVK